MRRHIEFGRFADIRYNLPRWKQSLSSYRRRACIRAYLFTLCTEGLRNDRTVGSHTRKTETMRRSRGCERAERSETASNKRRGSHRQSSCGTMLRDPRDHPSLFYPRPVFLLVSRAISYLAYERFRYHFNNAKYLYRLLNFLPSQQFSRFSCARWKIRYEKIEI